MDLKTFLKRVPLLGALLRRGAEFRRRVFGPITHFTTREPVVALTFDDGPNPEFTPRLLELLGRYGAKATFFMVGEAATRCPDLLPKVASQDHTIGNHSWSHLRFPGINGRERRSQLRACEEALHPFGQRLFRPPFGSESLAAHWDALRLGYRVINWSIGVPDWEDRPGEWIAEGILQQLRPGSIILLHDGLYHAAHTRFLNREPTLKAAEIVLQRVARQFRFITLPDMFRHGVPRRFGFPL